MLTTVVTVAITVCASTLHLKLFSVARDHDNYICLLRMSIECSPHLFRLKRVPS